MAGTLDAIVFQVSGPLHFEMAVYILGACRTPSHSGDLVFAGTRVPVDSLVCYLKGEHSIEEFLQDYPTVERWQIESYLELSPEGLDQRNCVVVSFPEVGTVTDLDLTYVVIVAEYKGQWIFCKHKKRDTWEIPGGHIEPGEKPAEAAARELREETGAEAFELKRICAYSVEQDGRTNCGLLFHARVEKLGKMPDSEIEETFFGDSLPGKLTHPEIQPDLFRKVRTELDRYRR